MSANPGADHPANGADTEAAEKPWASPEEWGPFSVSADTIEWVDGRGKQMKAEIWFPAIDEDNAELRPYAPLTMTGRSWARLDPDVRFAPHPLVAFSHGFTGIRFQSLFLTEFLASHGLVVVAPDHQHNTFLDMNDDHVVQVILERPGDIVSAVDEVFRRAGAGDDELFGLVEPGNYAVVGHSFGAFTALIVGGGQVDINGAIARCDAGRGRLCSDIRQISNEDVAAHTMTDDRAVVTVPMSPGIWYAFGPDGHTAPGLGHVRTPLVLAGDLDGVLRYEEEELPTYDALPSGKVLATFHGAGHYGFSDLCSLAPFLSDECAGNNNGWMEVEDVQRISKTITLAHIRHHLTGELRDVPWLAPSWLEEEPLVTTTVD